MQAAFEAMIDAKGKATAKTPAAAVDKAYAAGKSDEFVEPTVIEASRECRMAMAS